MDQVRVPGVSNANEPGAFDWERLITQIRRGHVVPIIGPELLPYHRVLAPILASQLQLPGEQAWTDISDVADAHARLRGDAVAAEDGLSKLLAASQTPSAAVQKLLTIEELRLLITTDYGSVVESAQVAPCRSLAFELGASVLQDLESYPTSTRCVYHLLGRAGEGRIALAKVDQLEFLYELLTERGPRGLLGLLGERRSLLFLGCNFPEWLAGLFTRILLGKPFYDTRNRGIEVFAGGSSQVSGASPFTAFLRANRVDVYAGDAIDFVEELVARYVPPPPQPANDQAGLARSRGAAFVSYERSNQSAARALVEELRKRNVDVWFDDSELSAGMNFQGEIRLAIQEECSAFIPLISRSALDKGTSYFIQEWHWAQEVRQRQFRDERFVFPVVIDDQPESEVVATLKRKFPEFADLHLSSYRGGSVDNRFVALLRDARKHFERSRRRATVQVGT